MGTVHVTKAEVRNSLPEAELARKCWYYMSLMREVEDRIERKLYRQGKIVGGVYVGRGQEAISVGAGLVAEPDDVLFPCHRDMAVFFIRGVPAGRVLAQYMGRAGGLTRGRDGNMHMGDLNLKIGAIISALAATVPVAVGAALGVKYLGKPDVVFSFFGEGATSRGDWHEGVNFATVQKLPVVFLCNNNHYAYSTPVEAQMACANVADRGAAYNMPAEIVDGNDVLAVHAATKRAVAHARSGKGPYLLECKTFRMTGHSAHDAAHYVPKHLFEEWSQRDPIDRMEKLALEEGWMDAAELDARRAALRAEVDEAVEWAERSPPARPRHPARRRLREPLTMQTTYLEAIRAGLWEEMERDPNVFVLGEDIGVYGGAFKVTEGFFERFGARRVIDTPISESAIVGAAIGASFMGLRPVAEMQFSDFITCGFDQIVNFAAKCRYRWNAPVPIVVRAPSGGGVHGGPFHSQNPEMWFVHTPGLKVVAPASAYDAKGLIKAAIRDNDPVIFLEHKALYRRIKEEVPEGDYTVPIGRAKVVREGSGLTIVTYGAMVWAALEAAETLAAGGASVEVVDLRTLLPLDRDTVCASVRKTSKALLVHEDTRTGGLAGELAATINETVFEYLDAPVLRLTAPDTPVPFSTPLEEAFLPNAGKIVEMARRLYRY